MDLGKLTWYVSRSGGIVAWTLLAMSLILGLLLSSRILGRKVSPAWTLSVHRFLGGLGVLFTAIHVGAIMLDDFVDFGVAEVFVPWASSWRPSAVAWGIVAMYLMLAIELTSFAMNRLPKKLWRGVHWMSAPLFGLASLHGYQAGADTGRAFILAIIGVMVVLALLTVVRVVRSRRNVEERVAPRTLLEQAKNRPAMRAEQPENVLGALTFSRPPPEVQALEERELVGVGARAEPGARLNPEVPRTRNAPPPKSRRSGPVAPSSLEDALPPVPWTPPEPTPPAPAESSVSTLPDDRHSPESFFGAPADPSTPVEPPTAGPPPSLPAAPRPKPRKTLPLSEVPAPQEVPREPAMSGAPTSEPAFGIEPPKPAWAKGPSEDAGAS